MKMTYFSSSKFRIKSFILVIYILIVFLSEKFYRSYLFNKSIDIEKKIYENTSYITINIFKIITNFGTITILIPLVIIIHLLLPINISYTFLSVLILSCYFDNILKIIYSNPRPFWIEPSIKKECDGGFGNPSGHSFTSFSTYLSLWNIIIERPFFENKKFLKIILFIIFFIFSFLIALSRIYLSVHSINQILFGSLLGMGLYFYFFHIIQLQKFNGKQFFKYITGSLEIKIHSIKFGIYLILLFLVYFFKKYNSNKYDNILHENCPEIPLYRKFKNDGFFVGLTIFFLIGAHYGLLFFINKIQVEKPFKNEEINKWTKENHLKIIIIQFLILIPHFILMILYFLIPENNISLIILFPLKVIIPFLLTGGFMFGIFTYICIKYKYAYKQIYVIYRIGTEAENNNSMSSIAISVKIRDSNEVNNLNK